MIIRAVTLITVGGRQATLDKDDRVHPGYRTWKFYYTNTPPDTVAYRNSADARSRPTLLHTRVHTHTLKKWILNLNRERNDVDGADSVESINIIVATSAGCWRPGRVYAAATHRHFSLSFLLKKKIMIILLFFFLSIDIYTQIGYEKKRRSDDGEKSRLGIERARARARHSWRVRY